VVDYAPSRVIPDQFLSLDDGAVHPWTRPQYTWGQKDFLRMAKGSLSELIVHMERAAALQLISVPDAEEAASLARRSRGAITRLILYREEAEAPGVKR